MGPTWIVIDRLMYKGGAFIRLWLSSGTWPGFGHAAVGNSRWVFPLRPPPPKQLSDGILLTQRFCPTSTLIIGLIRSEKIMGSMGEKTGSIGYVSRRAATNCSRAMRTNSRHEMLKSHENRRMR
jgi:hypothetical protein